VVTDPPTHTHKPTNRQDRLQYTTPQLARSVIIGETITTTSLLSVTQTGYGIGLQECPCSPCWSRRSSRAALACCSRGAATELTTKLEQLRAQNVARRTDGRNPTVSGDVGRREGRMTFRRRSLHGQTAGRLGWITAAGARRITYTVWLVHTPILCNVVRYGVAFNTHSTT